MDGIIRVYNDIWVAALAWIEEKQYAVTLLAKGVPADKIYKYSFRNCVSLDGTIFLLLIISPGGKDFVAYLSAKVCLFIVGKSNLVIGDGRYFGNINYKTDSALYKAFV